MKYDESHILDILRCVRHDFLNELQVLKANVALNKMDRVKTIIEEIVNKARNEAKLTNLHIPKLAMLLIGYNWKPQPFKLELEVTGDDADWYAYDEGLFTLVQDILNAFGKSSDRYTDNTVSISIHSDETSGTISICYSGKITNHEFLHQYFNQLHQTYHLVEKYIQNEEAVITFQLTDHLR
jgi:stage 0 sporulation protein B (sporulation initiation phosphotransferase)